MIELRWTAHGSPAYAAAVELRRKVLRIPLGLDFSPEQLAAEHGDLHLAAYDGEEIVGCLLLTDRGHGVVQMRQVAVDPTRQGQGIGALIVHESERRAKELGFTRMILHARATAVAFYARLGYAFEGEPFTEVGIPHQGMEKPL